MTKPQASIRRFDIFAEYTLLEKLAEGMPGDEAKGYGLWLAKVVAARKFGRLKPKAAGELTPQEIAERAGKKFRSLDGIEQTDKLFDRQIVARMGVAFYRQVFHPAVKAAFEEGRSYKDIRDEMRKDWQVKASEPAKTARPGEASGATKRDALGSSRKPARKRGRRTAK